MSCELELVDWLMRRARRSPFVSLGIGDDMAVLEPERSNRSSRNQAGGSILLSTDMLLDGVHFDTSSQPLSQVGRKAVACALSDCAAMAVRPVAAAVSVALPTTMSINRIKELMDGMIRMAEEFEATLVGGDTTSWTHPLAVDVAMMAVPFDGLEPIFRSGARPGDLIGVTGPLGGSILGKHLTFTPRVAEARSLRTSLTDSLHAMMDISDGLSLDLWRMCQASKVGAVLNEELLAGVVSHDAHRAASLDDRSPLDHALSDGEDFELLLAVAPEAVALHAGASSRQRIGNVELYVVGEFVDKGYSIRHRDGHVAPLHPKGYVH